MTTVNCLLHINEKDVYQIDRRKKENPKSNKGGLGRLADTRNFPCGGDTTCSYKLYKITEIIVDTVPSYRLDNLRERCSEAFFIYCLKTIYSKCI